MSKKKKNTSCQNCNLWKDCKTPCMSGYGNQKAQIMIVGEAPGFHEDELGRPFVGKAGQFLTECLNEAGINMDECYITNAVRCRPMENKTPTKSEIKACQEHLLKEIERIKPKYILTVGNAALQSLLGNSGIMKYRGQVFVAHGAKVFPTIHPAGVLRNPKFLPIFKSDIIRFGNEVRGDVSDGNEYKIKLIKNWKQLKKLKRILKKKIKIAYDFEAQSLDWKNAKIWMLGIATSRKRAYVIPLQHPTSPFKSEWRRVLHYFKSIFEDRSKFLIAQNGKYDNKLFRREGIFPFLKFDTMLAAHLLDENTPNDLEYLSMTMLGTRPYKRAYKIVFDPPSPLLRMAKYCGEDCCNTFGVCEKQINMLAEDERLENIFYNLKMPASRLFEKIEMNGLWIDAVKLHKNGKKVYNNMMKLEKKLNKLIPDNFPLRKKIYKTEKGFKNAIRSGKYGDDVKWEKVGNEYHIYLPFNLGSTQQLADLLYLTKRKGGWGLTPPAIKEAKTKTGNDATGEPVLVHLRNEHPGIELLIEYKGWRQLYNNFIKSWKEKIDPETSRLFPTFKLHGTRTHRLSSEDPNLSRHQEIKLSEEMLEHHQAISL